MLENPGKTADFQCHATVTLDGVAQHPHARPTPKPRPKNKHGGQRGHKKHDRALIPTEQCDDVQTLKPFECRRCGTRLSGSDPQPRRHQVWELPEIKPLVTEYQRHRLACPRCRETTCAPLPPGVPSGQSGPRLVAFAGLLMAYFRQSKRRTAQFMQTLLNQPCCPSLTVKMQTLVTDAVQPACDQHTAQLPDQARLSIDESPTKERKSKAWLWTFVARTFTVFAVRTSRAATILDDLLTDRFRGVGARLRHDVLAMRPTPMVLGAPETGFSGLDRPSGPPREASGA
jgi:transposase